jgi:hypothetical protein
LEGQLDLAKNEKKMVESVMQKTSDDTTTQLASTKALVLQLEHEKKVCVPCSPSQVLVIKKLCVWAFQTCKSYTN